MNATGVIEMAMRNDNRANCVPIETNELKLTRELKATTGIDEQRRAAGSSDNHARHRPIRMEGCAGAQ
jgi:hypothetical protein